MNSPAGTAEGALRDSAVPNGTNQNYRAYPGLSSWATFRSPFPGFPVELGGFGKLHAPFLTERRTRGLVQRSVAGNPGSPDFLWNLVALANFMRLSLLKVARAASSSAAWQDNPGSPD